MIKFCAKISDAIKKKKKKKNPLVFFLNMFFAKL